MKKGTLSPEEIIKMRKEIGMTQTELAGILGYSYSSVYLWESGKHKMSRQVEDEIKRIYAEKVKQ